MVNTMTTSEIGRKALFQHLQVCGVIKLPFCHRVIKLTQNCVS